MRNDKAVPAALVSEDEDQSWGGGQKKATE